jgi:hypothetical protein
MRHFLRPLVIYASLLSLVGCIQSEPMHDPIYPAANTSVTYTLEAGSSEGIKEAQLYEAVSTIDAAGMVTAGTEVLLQEWSFPGEPTTINISHTKAAGYPANRLVSYRYRIKSGKWYGMWSVTQTRSVTFAIRPYPVADQPAPVYVQGDIDDVFDIVFIPDTDITNMDTFRGHCRSMITAAVFAEPSIKLWNTQFNFYINPLTGTATDYDRIPTDGTHQKPTNWANLSFAEAKVLMHQNNLRDYATDGLFSTEQQNRGTMIHEGGHSLFGLADEYSGGAHWQAAEYPNNWDTLAGAQADAPDRHKTAADARQIGTSGWYKLCTDTCAMKVSGLVRNDYDVPCTDRVIYSIFDNALN